MIALQAGLPPSAYWKGTSDMPPEEQSANHGDFDQLVLGICDIVLSRREEARGKDAESDEVVSYEYALAQLVGIMDRGSIPSELSDRAHALLSGALE